MGVEIGSAIGSGISVGGGGIGGVEGGIGGAAVRSGPAVSAGIKTVVPSLELGFGRVMGTGDISPIVKEGPVSLPDVEVTMPVQTFNQPATIKPTEASVPEVFHTGLADINLDPNIKPLETSAKLAFLVEDSFSQINPLPGISQIKEEPLSKLQPQFFRPSWAVVSPDKRTFGRSYISTLLNPILNPILAPALEPSVTHPAQAVAIQPALEKKATEVVEQCIKIEEPQEILKEDEIEKIKLGLVEDKPKIETREDELGQAIELAAEEAAGLGIEGIEGWRVINKLVPQHSGDRSETLNEEDPQNTILDGSWESVKANIKSRKFTSVEEAKKVTTVINRKYRPERRGEGDDITEEEHQRVHQDHNHSSRRPLQILERRLVKKSGRSLGVNISPPLGS